MTTSGQTAVSKCLPPTSCEYGSDEMWVDLDNTGLITGRLFNVTVTSAVTGLINNMPCSRQVVLTATFDKLPKCSTSLCHEGRYSGNRMLKVEMFYGPTRGGWTFDIGDSPQNDGYGGDYGFTDYEAEVFGIGSSLRVHANDVGTACNAQLLFDDPTGINGNVVNVWVANNYVKVANDIGLCYRQCDECLFGLNGQPNTGSVNQDVHVAANRVIYNNARSGYGVCSMKLSWVDGPEV